MASAASFSMALAGAPAAATVRQGHPLAAGTRPVLPPLKPRRLAVRASASAGPREGAAVATLMTAAALVLPEIAEAAQPGISPSLRNFLLSIVSGGVVLGVIAGAVIAVANFDPVRRG